MPNATFRLAACIGLLVLGLCAYPQVATAQWLNGDDDTKTNRSMFRPLDQWPDPNDFRNAAGAPGSRYWQQRADYVIETELDTVAHVVSGTQRVTYHNNSPDVLRYVWFQLDQNVRSIEHSRTYTSQQALPQQITPFVQQLMIVEPFDGGFELSRVQVSGERGHMADAEYIINNTLMKVQLAQPLQPDARVVMEIDWHFRLHPDGTRGGRELVSDGWIYEVAQWYPRLAVYDDVSGWNTDQFLGTGEFFTEFGDFDVKITVPWNHIVDATGVLQNPRDVLTRTQRDRLTQAYQSEEPMFIVRADEIGDPSIRPQTSGMLTWHYKAENVRDFAWASSKTYVWDAAGYRYNPDDEPIAMHSLYPRDAMPLWDKVSTKAIAQTLRTFGRMAFPYPYPKAASINGPAFGMEYPMMAFNGPRPGAGIPNLEELLVMIIIHEVGHNWYPMIVNTDERQQAWMDEGINTFVEQYAKLEWDENFPEAYRADPHTILDYMQNPAARPIMTHPDQVPILQYGDHSYNKPAAGLIMLREEVVGPELFDQAFAEYSRNWAFKKPQPADFFRAIEEGAGEDLSWFWRGWFYTTHANDQAITGVTQQDAQQLLGHTDRGQFYYRVQLENEGGLLMPVQMDVTFEDGTVERRTFPVEIWRQNEQRFVAGLFADKPIVRIELDPDQDLTDVNAENNVWEAPELNESEVRDN